MRRILSLFFLLPVLALALPIEPDAVFVRVVDCGAGLATIVRMPGDHYMIYDAGHWTGQGSRSFNAFDDVIPDGAQIDLLVLSHSDADHQGAVGRIFDNNQWTINTVLRGGLERLGSNTWVRANNAIRAASNAGNTLDINLRFFEFPMGSTYRFGEVYITMVSGFYTPPDNWDIRGGPTGSEFRNAGSIVIRLYFAGRTILFTGDAVGRHIGDPANAIIASERFMVENSEVIPIDSDVLIAPHHGADNASSTDFINAVSPEWVIFSAGSAHRHPRADAAQRYLDNGVALDHIFRTDLGDNEGGEEWDHGMNTPGGSVLGRDNIDILIRPSGEVLVEYHSGN